MKNDKKPTIHQVKVYSIVTLLLIIVGSGISYWTADRIEYYTMAVMHTSEVLQLTDELYSSIIERETNIRGFVITGEKEFLRYYNQSNLNAEKLLTDLKLLTMDNSQQQNNIEELRGLIKARVRTFEATLLHINEHGDLKGFLDSSKVNSAIIGYQLIKESVTHIKDIENELFVERNTSLLSNINALPFIVGLIAVFSITIGLVTFFSIYQYNKAQQEAHRELSLYQIKLKDQIKLLDDSNKELEQFAYVASHDLQEPLRKITAFSDLLNDQFAEKLEGEGALYLQRITAASVRMRRLITDLLEYSRAGRVEIDKITTVTLSTILAGVLEDFELAIQEKSAKITVGNLPIVKGSETEYRQVFQNLISNSLKFSDPNKTIEINLSSEKASQEFLEKFVTLDKNINYHLIKVSDNGIGFAKEHAEKIFSIFQRLHGKTEYEGTGIGLSITRKIIEKNGGFIYAESSPGFGCVFTILLPEIIS